MKARKIFQLSLVLAFLILITLPSLGLYFDLFQTTWNTENRDLAEKPELRLDSLGQYPRSYERYFGDHFGLRSLLIRWNSIVRVKWFGISPLHSVVLGKDSWLFYRSEAVQDGASMNDYLGISPLSPKDLETIKRNLERDYSEMSRLGIIYLVVIVPNKHTVYGEYLPENLRALHESSSTRMDQLTDYLAGNPGLEIVDLRAPLKKAKIQNPVYYKTDTHWNDYGAFVGYERIMHHLTKHFPHLRPMEIAPSDVMVYKCPTGGDLPEMLAMADLWPEENHAGVDWPSNPPIPRLGSLFFKHDSFGDNLYEPFYRHFHRVSGLPPFTRFDWKRLERERPDVVLHVLAERYINMALHDDYYLKEDGHTTAW